jgi:hypothetical protein
MKQILSANWIFGAIPVIVLFTALTPAVAATMVSAPPGGLDVRIVNTPSDPVPVAIGEPVEVTIQGQPPVPQPYQATSGDAGAEKNPLIVEFSTVPDGYRLEIHDIAGTVEASRPDPGDIPPIVKCTLSRQTGGLDTDVRAIPVGAPLKVRDTARIQVVSESVLMSIAAGQYALLRCDAAENVPQMQLLAYLAGILVPLVE